MVRFSIDFSGLYRIVVQNTRSFCFRFRFLIFSRKECFSHNRILGGFNSVFNNLFQQFVSIIGLKCLSNAIPSSILSVFKAWHFLRIESLISAISLAIFSRSLLLSLPCQRIEVNWSHHGIIKSLNPFLYRPSVSALALSLEIHTFAANLQHKSQKSS